MENQVHGAFPNEDSLLRGGFIRMDVIQGRITNRRYLTLEKERLDKETGLRQITEDLRLNSKSQTR